MLSMVLYYRVCTSYTCYLIYNNIMHQLSIAHFKKAYISTRIVIYNMVNQWKLYSATKRNTWNYAKPIVNKKAKWVTDILYLGGLSHLLQLNSFNTNRKQVYVPKDIGEGNRGFPCRPDRCFAPTWCQRAPARSAAAEIAVGMIDFQIKS